MADSQREKSSSSQQCDYETERTRRKRVSDTEHFVIAGKAVSILDPNDFNQRSAPNYTPRPHNITETPSQRFSHSFVVVVKKAPLGRTAVIPAQRGKHA